MICFTLSLDVADATRWCDQSNIVKSAGHLTFPVHDWFTDDRTTTETWLTPTVGALLITCDWFHQLVPSATSGLKGKQSMYSFSSTTSRGGRYTISGTGCGFLLGLCILNKKLTAPFLLSFYWELIAVFCVQEVVDTEMMGRSLRANL